MPGQPMPPILSYWTEPNGRRAIIAAAIFCALCLGFLGLAHELSLRYQSGTSAAVAQKIRDFNAYYDGVDAVRRNFAAEPQKYRDALNRLISGARRAHVLPRTIDPSPGEIDLATMIEESGPRSEEEKEFLEYLKASYPEGRVEQRVKMESWSRRRSTQPSR